MDHDDYRIRRMTQAEVERIAVEWAAREGWNPGLADSGPFFATDSKGFLVGELNGEIVSCISAVAYDEAFGFVGFYIVRPEYRGRGFGLRIWNGAMEYMGKRNVSLDGVLAQQDNYRKSGFALAYRNIRYEGAGGGAVASNVRPLGDAPFEELFAYDTACFPVPRERFLRPWLAMPNAWGACVMKDGRLRGYGLIRSCRRGYKIGPLFADTPELADEIFRSLRSRATAADPVCLDVPEVNGPARALAERHGMKVVFETARMYTRGAPDMRVEKIFGVTTFELG